jgi:hypothetical protein
MLTQEGQPEGQIFLCSCSLVGVFLHAAPLTRLELLNSVLGFARWAFPSLWVNGLLHILWLGIFEDCFW